MEQLVPPSAGAECLQPPPGQLGAILHSPRPKDIEEQEALEAMPEDIEVNERVSERPQSIARDASSFKPRTVGPYSPHTVLLLIPASMLGLLARLGISALGTYEGRNVFPLAFVQGAGCFIMGFCLGIREPLSEYYPEIYIAIASGFCGSLTTFSAMQLDIFLSWSNSHVSGGNKRIWIYSIMDGIAILIVTTAVSWSATGLGHTFSVKQALPVLKAKIHSNQAVPSLRSQQVLNTLSVAIYITALTLYFVLSPAYRPIATSALLFAFPGALMRYSLANILNSRIKAIPLGTLSANIVGSLLLALFYVLERIHQLDRAEGSSIGAGGSAACSMLKGLADGFTGCLTTVSTFVVELRTLRHRDAWAYGCLSIFIGQVAMTIVVGSAQWSGYINPSSGCLSADL